MDIERAVTIRRSPRVAAIETMFDVPLAEQSARHWRVSFAPPNEWSIGAIVGPSGSGKTTIARALFGEVPAWTWPTEQSILDAFPSDMGAEEIALLLSSVGFSSPPAWVRPFGALSTGEQFRVSLARMLAERPAFAVVDEFTSVVDRTVAQIGSAAVARAVRRRGGRFVAVTCHYDVLEWLEPDWIYEPATDTMRVGRFLQRPRIELEIARVHYAAWNLFRQHHYLSHALNRSAACFVAFWRGAPVAFSAWLPLFSGTLKNAWREHRTVCLPDYQGIGIGNAISNYCASMVAGMGRMAMSTTSHPAMIRSRLASPLWEMHRAPSRVPPHRGTWTDAAWASVGRETAGFRWVGAPMDLAQAAAVWSGIAP